MDIRIKLEEYKSSLIEEELEERTIKKYISDIMQYLKYANIIKIEDINKKNLIEFKQHLIDISKSSTTNNKLIIINKFLNYLKLDQYKLKLLRIQKRTSLNDTISITDYERLQRVSKRLNKVKIYYIMRVLAETGIRIEELKYVTVEAVKQGTTQVTNKKKIRNIIFNKTLSKELLKYCKNTNINNGIIFHGRNYDKAISKSYVWQQLKYIARTSSC